MSGRLQATLRHAVTDRQREIAALGPWFHNLRLPSGEQTAPEHPLGDFPAFKWRDIQPYVAEDLSGWTALDIGCNAGFYSLRLAERGARVTAVDVDLHYLRQARWAARQFQLDDRITFRQAQVYTVARERKPFDLVWFMGVFYHLRYPLLALDALALSVKRMLVFQTLTFPSAGRGNAPSDLGLHERNRMQDDGWPKLAFVEQSFEGDPTNWWAANACCVEAMLRSAGLEVVARPHHETWICIPAEGAKAAARRAGYEEQLRTAAGWSD